MIMYDTYDIGENSSNELMQWFSNNQMKANADKCHLFTNCNEESSVCIDHRIIKNSKCEKLLVVKFHQQLNFNPHSNNICKKSRTKTKCIVYNCLHHKWIPQRAKCHFYVSIHL